MNYWHVFADQVGGWMSSFLPLLVTIVIIVLFVELWQRGHGKE